MEVHEWQSRKLVVEVHESRSESVHVEGEIVGSSQYQPLTKSSGHSEVLRVPMSLNAE